MVLHMTDDANLCVNFFGILRKHIVEKSRDMPFWIKFLITVLSYIVGVASIYCNETRTVVCFYLDSVQYNVCWRLVTEVEG